MTGEHFIFIPGVLLVGAIIGYIFCSRAAIDNARLEIVKEQERKLAREKRAARKEMKKEKSKDSNETEVTGS